MITTLPIWSIDSTCTHCAHLIPTPAPTVHTQFQQKLCRHPTTRDILISDLGPSRHQTSKEIQEHRCKTQKVVVRPFLLNGEGDGGGASSALLYYQITRPTKLSLASFNQVIGFCKGGVSLIEWY
ncbi:uncharacterized protein PGTG_02827 [Puccinia graminis f. sp. tritici CRL 75-36-700-3]|uniref:Uncharacterized protein n=1 Tax=Puccinia graminis f. sp. tritici (strain CRL 75-36-700-3 / race SCCL) TaxID=418459 RepID=E3JWG1_PUCGT|nr:uncharacterized protein PGTG_02827 [Puccinia graminis f. sp. tritici CRL 75-36-700-3]EFP76386.1 hypothetical protein PGTG_02827 [Puccinia graminis f. sp. tritici CRL 75-36-700-3]